MNKLSGEPEDNYVENQRELIPNRNYVFTCSIDFNEDFLISYGTKANGIGLKPIRDPAFKVKGNSPTFASSDLTDFFYYDPVKHRLYFTIWATNPTSARLILGFIAAKMRLGTMDPRIRFDVEVWEGI